MPTATTNAKCQARDDIDQGSSGALYFNTSHRSHPPGTTHRFPQGGMMFCLAGEFRVTASSRETRSFEAGDCLLMEDTSGEGHITEVASHRSVKAVMIR